MMESTWAMASWELRVPTVRVVMGGGWGVGVRSVIFWWWWCGGVVVVVGFGTLCCSCAIASLLTSGFRVLLIHSRVDSQYQNVDVVYLSCLDEA
jgi:hypothetical protein